jgi:hypothetical protein
MGKEKNNSAKADTIESIVIIKVQNLRYMIKVIGRKK